LKIALDTNAYSLLHNGIAPQLKDIIEQSEQIVLPFVVIGELKAGFQKGTRTEKNYLELVKFVDLDRVSVQWSDDDTLELYAKIWTDLARRGKPIPTNDIWIAALCVQHDLPLATNDSDFDNISLLQTIKVA
jgi:tRNA(fMet)-specific endonuclease VapC